MHKRELASIIEKRLREQRRFICVIQGPRQVGKTTLITQVLDELRTPHVFASADAVFSSGNTWISQQWEAARIRQRQSGAEEFILVIDEIQKIINWSEAVKALWDEDSTKKTPIKVVLLGSSRLLLQQGLTESLAGRFESFYLGHWSLTEMQQVFSFNPEQFVWFGGYPGAADLITDEARWKHYVKDALIETSISKDILMMSQVDKPALMRRLFEFGCLYSSQILSFNKILGQLQDAGNTTTLSHYLNLTHSAGLLGGLEKFSPGMVRQRSSSPKFQVHNTALISAQQHKLFEEARVNPELWGRMVESSVGAHLLNQALTKNFNIYYWRHRNDEIDFVLEYKDRIIGLEIKIGISQKASGMDAFNRQFNPDKVLLVGNSGIPWQEFLTIDPVNLF